MSPALSYHFWTRKIFSAAASFVYSNPTAQLALVCLHYHNLLTGMPAKFHQEAVIPLHLDLAQQQCLLHPLGPQLHPRLHLQLLALGNKSQHKPRRKRKRREASNGRMVSLIAAVVLQLWQVHTIFLICQALNEANKKMWKLANIASILCFGLCNK